MLRPGWKLTFKKLQKNYRLIYLSNLCEIGFNQSNRVLKLHNFNKFPNVDCEFYL